MLPSVLNRLSKHLMMKIKARRFFWIIFVIIYYRYFGKPVTIFKIITNLYRIDRIIINQFILSFKFIVKDVVQRFVRNFLNKDLFSIYTL